MKLYEFLQVMDYSLPVWINQNGFSDYYDRAENIDKSRHQSEIEMVTQTGENEIVIELF